MAVIVSLSCYKHDKSDAHQEQVVSFLRTAKRDDDPIAALANWFVWNEDLHSGDSFLESLDRDLTAVKHVSRSLLFASVLIKLHA